jgi:uncharacterized membrane protein
VDLHPFRREINPGVGGESNVRIQTTDVALTAIYAALYAALSYVTIPISFGVAQFRIEGALRLVETRYKWWQL